MKENNTKYIMEISRTSFHIKYIIFHFWFHEMYLVLYLSISRIFHIRTEFFNNSTCFTIFTMYHNVYKIFSEMLCEILHTDFTKMAALLQFFFATAMLAERIPTATMLTAASQS